MATSNPVSTQGHEGENSASPHHQPAVQRVLSPFSGKLPLDKKLKLSQADFKRTIKNLFSDKVVNPVNQLTATPAFPAPHVLAQFANKAYTGYKKGETEAEYEKQLALPDGWKLLTTASNNSKANGYFGVAYWHSEHQQVVIAHRGTKLTNLGALFADVVGVLFKKHVPQMGSASTFAHKVVEVLQEVNQEKGTNFEVFFTGHSLGGWLAQITNFTTKYLEPKDNTFLKSGNIPQNYHPHTVVFDSPGCKDMLSEMTDKFDVRLHGRSISLKHLDITSYLSAPNRFNTCNTHLGTVYRIFPDLSDMDWWEKHTAFYNKVTHSMDKIVKVFDPETGQVLKDEEGKLKIQLVVDWPVTAGLSGGKEYKRFFKWAKHFNNYDPDITGELKEFMHYHEVRYQVATYDERVSRLSVFCQQERQFLESFRRLRQVPEFVKPKELFRAMEDNEAQENVEIILKSFEIEKDTIRCTDGSALQTLVPYVKRLLQQFPQVKENVETALSSNEFVNCFYRDETRRYVGQINEIPLHFKPDTLCLRDFLSSDELKLLQVRMVDGDAWTGLVKVYQMLGKEPSMTEQLSEGHYTILTLKHLLHVHRGFSLNRLMESTSAPHLLMISCETNQRLNDEDKQVFRSLFNILKQKQTVKFVLTTQSEDDIGIFLQELAKETISDGFVATDVKLSWCDLTPSSQEKLLQNAVKIQGARVSLNEIMSAGDPVANFLALGALLEDKELTIANPVPIANAFSESYYIGRTLRHEKCIKEEIYRDKEVLEKRVFLASSEQEFKQLCQLYPNSNVHWLQKEKSGKLLWQQSQGSLETVRRYIDTDSSHTFTDDDLDKLLEQAQQQRVLLISDTAGMGKSTVLTHLSKKIKQNFPTNWVVRIDLNDHTEALDALQGEQMSKEKAIDFVWEKLLKMQPGLEVELFKHCCQKNQKVKIVMFLDGFDEISPRYKDTVIDLLQVLRQTAVEQIWVTTRPHLRKELEDNLQQLSYTLEPFSEEDQVEFLSKFWCQKDWFTEAGSETEDEGKTKLEICAKKLIKELYQSISDKDKQFTGIPLQCRMLAEAIEKEVKAFFQSVKTVPELPWKLDMLGLYKIFMNRKYDIYLEEKFKFPTTSVGSRKRRKQLLKDIIENHQTLALKMMFAEEELAFPQTDSQYTPLDEDLIRIGIVQMSYEGKLHFIHRTFAEFYVAEFFVNQLTKGSNISQQIQDFLLQKIFRKAEYRVIRVFIDELLTKCNPTKDVLKQYGNRIHDLAKDSELTLHQSTREGKAKFIEFLLASLKAAGHAESLVKLLLAEDCNRHTAWQEAARSGSVEVLGKLWEWAKDVLNRDELKNKLLLATDYKEKTVFHNALNRGNVEILERIWIWAKEQMSKEELNKLLLVQSKYKSTAFHVAARTGRVDVLDKLWEWAKEVLNRDELNNKLLLATDYEENTVLHNALLRDNVQTLERVWNWVEKQLSKEELNKLFLAQDKYRRTAWHVAARTGKVKTLDKLWEWAKEVLNSDELKNKLLLATDCDEKTVLHNALIRGNVQILQRIWNWAKEQMSKEEKNKLLLVQNKYRSTAFHVAALTGRVEALDKMWEWAKEVLNTDELKNKLLLATDYEESTVLHNALISGNVEILERIWMWAKEELSKEELNKILLTQDKCRRTAWHVAARTGRVDVLDKLWEWAKKVLNSDELKNKLLLATDCDGKTVLHNALNRVNVQTLERVWKWTKEQLSIKELNKLLLVQNKYRSTAFHVAARTGTVEVLDKLWEWAKEVLNREELKSKLLLATDYEENTVMHNALFRVNVKTLERVWSWAIEHLSEKEINKLFLAQDKYRRTAWHVAAKTGRVEVLDKFWEWAKGVLNTDEINNKWLFATDHHEKTVLHNALVRGNVQVLERIWKWAREQLSPEELNKLMLVQNKYRSTAWHVAARTGKLKFLKKLWEWSKEVLHSDELNSKLLLATDYEEYTVLHNASLSGNVPTLERILKWAKEQLSKEELNKLFLAQDKDRRTAWHLAARTGRVEVLDKLCEWSKDVLNREELNNKLLLATDNEEHTVLHNATFNKNEQLIERIWNCAKKQMSKQKLNKFLLAQDKDRRTVWHLAARNGRLEILDKLWEWAKELLNTDELNHKFLLATDNEENTVLHHASISGNVQILQWVLKWAKQQLSKEESYKLLLAQDKYRMTAWHVAARIGILDLLDKLWEWAKEVLNSNELNSKLLLATDYEGNTVLHNATFRENTQVLERIRMWAKEQMTPEELNKFLLLQV